MRPRRRAPRRAEPRDDLAATHSLPRLDSDAKYSPVISVDLHPRQRDVRRMKVRDVKLVGEQPVPFLLNMICDRRRGRRSG